MVCIPCILIPFALWVYCKFIQPYVLRFIPVNWRSWADSWLYPVCPLQYSGEEKTKDAATSPEKTTENTAQLTESNDVKPAAMVDCKKLE
ncbi:unnamed protein product [Soboliphyme baturini]|uniref:UPF0729 protein n=1 Tax=Soboliphyme baturini TaxID=241478 RepID=A0A183IIY8_9BILA|nr:unnamed protein product [Soboliphyme baturini]